MIRQEYTLCEKWKQLPKEDRFLGISISELESLSCVPIHVTDSQDSCTAGWTDNNEIYLNNSVDIDCIKRRVTQRLSRVKNSVEVLKKLSDAFKSYSNIARFLVLHEVGHIRLGHFAQKAEIQKLEDEGIELMKERIREIFKDEAWNEIDPINEYREALEAEVDCWSLNELEKYAIIEQD